MPGASLVHVGEGGSAAGQINDELAGLDRAVVASDRVDAAAEQFQWPLALGLLLLLAERLVARRRLVLDAQTPAAA